MVLSARITRHLSRVEPPAVASLGSSNTVWRIFIALSDQSSLLPSSLANALAVDRSIVSRALARLHALGLVSRRVDPTDRRQVRVSLSARGRRTLNDYLSSVAVAFAGAATAVDEFCGPQVIEDADARRSARGFTVLSLETSLNELAVVGSTVVRDFLDIEAEFGVSGWQQRFTSWAAAAAPEAPAEELAQDLGLDPSSVSQAMDGLGALGLLDRNHPDRTVRLTPRGLDFVRRQAAAFVAHREDLVRALTNARAAAATRDRWHRPRVSG